MTRAAAAPALPGGDAAPPEARRLRWSVRVDGALEGTLNMARDHALAESVSPGTAFLRLYGWARPTLSLGRNEPARGLWDLDAAAEAGVGFVRRPTGGRAVLHHRELTYAVAVPDRALGGPRSAYRLVSLALVGALASTGVAAEIASDPGPAARPDAGPCFQRPADGEVTFRGRKLVGSAQARIGGGLLQHGSILIEDDQGLADRLAGGGIRAGDRPATLTAALGRPPAVEELAEALITAFGEILGGRWTRVPTGPASPEEETLVRRRYGRDSWTWRR